ncbi:uncharacterized protein [Gossypium hirsutum]|uniref:DNA/RNA polymerases superfamily protein n=1 Tax=Gossypium hirsutum TaxID=3635 RepID=A0A1U8JKL3_GOSHI|nr:uncharacterized protein LOC107908064 [Gossypium hirsutum]
MLRSCVIDFGGNWDNYLPLAKFVYNNSYQKIIQMEPFEALHGWRCKTPLCWSNMEKKRNLGPELVREVEDKERLVCEWLKAASDRQKSYADLRLRVSECIHNVFHVSMLRKYISDLSHVVLVEEINVRSDLSYDKEPVAILDRKVKVLHNKTVLLVKVLWCNHKEATWESEDVMQRQYPYLFDSGKS